MARTPKTLDQARGNLESSLAQIGSRYLEGVQRGSWAEAAASDQSEANFAQQMQRVIQNKLRAAGIRRAGDTSWRAGAESKGAPVIGQRIRDELAKWESNFGQVYQQILRAQANLRPRTLDATANIDNRVKPIVQAAKEAARRRRS